MHMQYEPRKADFVIPVQESEQAIPVKESMATHYNSRNTSQGSAHAISVKESAHTAREIPFMYYFSGNSVASAPVSTFMCLRAIYIL
jgi:hypothetical protein